MLSGPKIMPMMTLSCGPLVGENLVTATADVATIIATNVAGNMVGDQLQHYHIVLIISGEASSQSSSILRM